MTESEGLGFNEECYTYNLRCTGSMRSRHPHPEMYLQSSEYTSGSARHLQTCLAYKLLVL